MIRSIVLIPITVDFTHYAKGEAIELTTSEFREMEAAGIVHRYIALEKRVVVETKEEKITYQTKDEKKTNRYSKSNKPGK